MGRKRKELITPQVSESTLTTTYEQMKTDDLIPYARNARRHSPEQVLQIASSIREFGFLAPIVVAGDNTVVAGHGRLEAAKKLELATVPVVRASHLSKAQIQAYALVDNRLGETSDWDKDLLRLELDEVLTQIPTLNLMGFDEQFLGAPFEFKPPSEDGGETKAEKLELRVECETQEQLDELFAELRDRDYQVRR